MLFFWAVLFIVTPFVQGLIIQRILRFEIVLRCPAARCMLPARSISSLPLRSTQAPASCAVVPPRSRCLALSSLLCARSLSRWLALSRSLFLPRFRHAHTAAANAQTLPARVAIQHAARVAMSIGPTPKATSSTLTLRGKHRCSAASSAASAWPAASSSPGSGAEQWPRPGASWLVTWRGTRKSGSGRWQLTVSVAPCSPSAPSPRASNASVPATRHTARPYFKPQTRAPRLEARTAGPEATHPERRCGRLHVVRGPVAFVLVASAHAQLPSSHSWF